MITACAQNVMLTEIEILHIIKSANPKKDNICATRAKHSASGKITPFGQCRVKCVMDVATTDVNVLDCTNVMMELVDQFVVQNLNWTPGIVWGEIKKHYDSVSKWELDRKNDTEVMNRERCMQHLMV